MTPTLSAASWRTWGLFDWNQALFDYFFRLREGENDAPVSRLVVTPETMQAVAEASDGPEGVVEVFLAVVRERLARLRRNLCTDALRLEWSGIRSSSIPPFVAHLVVTCLAASQPGRTGNFRRRLNRLLGHDPNDPSYDLRQLPEVWRRLRAWLRYARRRGEPYRELILPSLGRETHIGHSLRLAFPHHRDLRRLIDLLTSDDLAFPPPVLPVLQLVSENLDDFSPRFRRAFHQFWEDFDANRSDLYRRPFWAAVRDALRRPASLETDQAAPRAQLRLVFDDEWRFIVEIWLDVVPTLPDGMRAEAIDEEADGPFRFRIIGGTEGRSDAAALLLRNQFKEKALGLGHAVADGVLLFVLGESGYWCLAVSLPTLGEVRAGA